MAVSSRRVYLSNVFGPGDPDAYVCMECARGSLRHTDGETHRTASGDIIPCAWREAEALSEAYRVNLFAQVLTQ